MSASCEQLSPFVDGELSPSEAEAFRDHLATCEACERGLHERMMLEAIETTHAPVRGKTGGGGGDVRPIRPSPRWLSRSVAPVLFATLSAAAAWALLARGRTPNEPTLQGASAPSLESAKTRSSEVRLAYAAADAYRPYDVERAGGERKHEDVPLATLAALEAHGDLHGVAAGLVLAGDDGRAESYLARASASVDVDADRAAVLVDRGDAAQALEALDAVLAKKPDHPQALFNRALALRDLRLTLVAAEAFERVAALGEKGWANEARRQAAALRAANDRRQGAWKTGLAAGKAMVAGGPVLADDVVDATPDVARHYLYHSARAATSSARALELAPLARRLDARAGGHVLEQMVERAAKDDFGRRALWGETYAKLLLSPSSVDPASRASYLAALRKAGESDILLGALPLLGQDKANIDEYARLAAATGDPWQLAMAERARAAHAVAAGDYSSAEATLRRALAACIPAHIEWKCALLEDDLAWILATEVRTTELRAVALSGLERGRAFAAETEWNFLLRLTDVARMEGRTALLGAYARELELLRPDDCDAQRDARMELVVSRVVALDTPGLVQELASIPRCDQPLTVFAADPIVDAIRMGGKPAGADTLASELAAVRENAEPADKAFADVLLARLAFVTDPAAGERFARRALAEAAKLPKSDALAKKASTYARLTLAVGAAAAGRGADALAEVAAGTLQGGDGTTGRASCVLGVAIDDDRALAVTSDARGTAVAELTKRASAAITPESLVSKEARARLAGCPDVHVYALPPLHGLPELLPADLAWGYVSTEGEAAPPAYAQRRVVVSDVIPPPELALPRLGSWGPPSETTTWLHGEGATPSAVLFQIANATEVEIHAHGIVDAAQSSASIVVLTPDRNGEYAFSAADLREGTLKGHPIVVLGACQAARTAPYYHEAWSLPNAFVLAGARAVFASPAAIRDAEASPFFDAVLARVRGGASPAVALRDERASWLARDPKSWVGQVIDFE